MDQKYSRREILKMMTLLGLAQTRPVFFDQLRLASRDPNAQNVLVILFDALSAKNISLYGYPRETMPKLAKLAEQAIVYHNHYAGGGYTTPATASLLTGTLPWTHRAFNPHATVAPEFEQRNLFSEFGRHGYYRVGYTHNILADVFIKQFSGNMEKPLSRQDLFLNDYWVSDLFENDYDTALLAVLRSIEDNKDGVTSGFFLPQLWDRFLSRQRTENAEAFKKLFPLGLPNVKANDFLLETAVDWLNEQVPAWPQPFLGYFHFLPPHDPYKTRRDFFHTFANDGWEPVEKPEHPFTMGEKRNKNLRERINYDEFILYVDSEFRRLYRLLKKAGILENTWLVFTSDHGEMFERGIWGHTHVTLLEPRAHIPLLIFPPGGTQRVDVYDTTSAVDVLPTLMHLTGHPLPDWGEGLVLPPFNASGEHADRAVFSMESDENEKYGEFTVGTFMIIRDGVKLIYYFGYPSQPDNKPYYEMYDLKDDPEELNNLYAEESSLARRLREELHAKLREVDQPYLSS